jgi:hypothetical protein
MDRKPRFIGKAGGFAIADADKRERLPERQAGSYERYEIPALLRRDVGMKKTLRMDAFKCRLTGRTAIENLSWFPLYCRTLQHGLKAAAIRV